MKPKTGLRRTRWRLNRNPTARTKRPGDKGDAGNYAGHHHAGLRRDSSRPFGLGGPRKPIIG